MMSNFATIGLDIAKSVFELHGVDAAGEIAVCRKLTRRRVLTFFESLPRCLGRNRGVQFVALLGS
jgi:transposase